ncbi:MAG TPA: flagellar M-ring protein FliF [Firmicutes bacterium]|nr:flagellar M-ring protein FliF [Candidatus Fermentithermobacillaceae bacterium]
MPTNLSGVLAGVKDAWGKLGKTSRNIIIGAIALAFLTTALLAGLNARGTRFETLWSNLDPTDAGAIVSELERQSIQYKLEDGGRTIKVPADVLYRTRLSLASQGLPASGVVGFESIGANGIWATDFERKVQYVRALSGELTRTIKTIYGVMDARVHIVLPEDSVFVSQRKPATAAVLLQLQPMTDLSPSCVKGIVNLVARSVEGLSPSEVTVMDSQGRLLSQDAASLYGSTAISGAAFELTAQVEREFEKRLVSMLTPVLGAGNVVCQVRAELDLNQVRTVETTYNGEGEGVLRSTQEITETYSGAGTMPGGQAGGLDVPNYSTAGSGNSEFQRSEITRNYEVGQRVVETMNTPGAVKNLSVAVLVNKELDDDAHASIVETVSAALGLDPLRNDRISVTGIPFNTSLADTINGAFQPAPVPYNKLYVYGAAVAAALVLGTVILYLGRRRRRGTDTISPPVLPESEPEEERALPPEYVMRQRTRESVERLARVNPATVAALLRTWILEDER